MSNFFEKGFERKKFVDKANACNNLIGVEVKQVVTIKDGVTTIRDEKRKIDYTRKVNETAKVLKGQNSDLLEKMSKMIEMEI